jgi:hypothetical protein
LRWGDLELVVGERQDGLAIGRPDAAHVGGSGAAEAVDQPVGELGGLAGRRISCTHNNIVAAPWVEPQYLDGVPCLFKLRVWP